MAGLDTATVMTMATLRVAGREAARVTEVLGITPDDPGNRADVRRPPGDPAGVWLLASSNGPLPGVELAVALGRLLDRVEPVADRLWTLVSEGCAVTWRCYLGSRSLEHAAVLDRSILTRMLRLPGELWLDLYPEDEDG